jgi:hypothetical protein
MNLVNVDAMPSGVGSEWRRSSRSYGNGNCVEVRSCGSSVQVRDSKSVCNDFSAPILEFNRHDWVNFIRFVVSGEVNGPAI